jgi:hypothetical protein
VKTVNRAVREKRVVRTEGKGRLLRAAGWAPCTPPIPAPSEVSDKKGGAEWEVRLDAGADVGSRTRRLTNLDLDGPKAILIE